MMRVARVFLVVSFVCSVASVGKAQTLYSFRTERQNLIYPNKLSEYLVPHTARCFENALSFHQNLFDYHTDREITVLMQDFGDYANGAAGVGPRNLVSIGMAPVSNVYETLPANERMNWVMNHELVHIVTLDQAAPADRFWRTVFSGKATPTADNPLSMVYAYLVTPRTYSTRWYREGVATFVETWMAGGLGRALGSYDEMVFRTMVADEQYFYDWVGLEAEGTKVDFQVGAIAYLYGTRFFTYLANVHGPEKVIDWAKRTDGTRAHFASHFEQVFGTSLTDGWNDWIRFEHEWQRMNLDSVRRLPLTPYRLLSKQAVGSVSRSYYIPSRRSILAAVNYPGQVPHIALISMDDGSMAQVCEVKGATLYDVSSLAFDPETETAFFSIDNNNWRDLASVNIRTGDVTVLQRDTRIGELVFNRADRSLWGVRHDLGYASIVRMEPPYTDWSTIYTWPYGQYITDVDISPDGTRLSAAHVSISGRQKLIMMRTDSLLAKDGSYQALYDFDTSVPANFIFSPDGSSLVGTSYYTGVSNVFRYDLAGNDMQLLSNCETGFFRPMHHTDDSLIVFRYSGRGFIPAAIRIDPLDDVGVIQFLGNAAVEKHPVLASWVVPPPSKIDLDPLKTFEGEYSPLWNIKVASLYPVVEGYKDVVAAGVRLNLSDPIMLHNINMTVSYSPHAFLKEEERLHAAVNYKVWSWQFRAAYNGADFYDLFGPTKTSRKGYSLTAAYKLPLLLNDPEIIEADLFAGAYGGLERLPDFQNVLASFSELYTARARLSYHWLRKSLGAADQEKGIAWEIVSHNNYVRSDIFPLVYGGLDLGVPLPFNHTAVWLRTSAGYSFGDKNDPFGNFFFGGFGNNWVDHQDTKRYRSHESFPGIDLNAAGGATYGKAMLELLLPPVRFRNAGVWFFYAAWAHPTLFASVLSTNPDDAALRRNIANIGGQIDVKLSIISALDATLSAGYAVAFEKGMKPSRELMVSLKIL